MAQIGEHVDVEVGVIVNLRGKHGRVRGIPMPGWAKGRD
jgi:hypothetical protein